MGRWAYKQPYALLVAVQIVAATIGKTRAQRIIRTEGFRAMSIAKVHTSKICSQYFLFPQPVSNFSLVQAILIYRHKIISCTVASRELMEYRFQFLPLQNRKTHWYFIKSLYTILICSQGFKTLHPKDIGKEVESADLVFLPHYHRTPGAHLVSLMYLCSYCLP